MPEITFVKFKDLKHRGGFTLIELLVVIAILGLLASIVMSSLSSARDKAKYARAKTEIKQFMNAVVYAQGEQGQTLIGITQNGCSDCPCRDTNIKNISEASTCYVNWLNALADVENATNGAFAGLQRLTRDPWGSPYGLDENEREGGANDCRQDTIRSAGPDGILYNSDDQGYLIPFSKSCP